MADGQERVAIVTGAGTGIGQAIALELARTGIRTVIVGRRPAPLEETVARSPKTDTDRGVFSGHHRCGRPDSRRSDDAAIRFGRVDILVNNAGVSSIEPLLSASEEEWRRVMATNVDAAFFMTQAVLPSMRERQWGRIVNIGSVYGALALNPSLYDAFTDEGTLGPKRQPAYHTSKGAILNLTRDLAAAVAKWKITVNTVSPGMVVTSSRTEFSPRGRAEALRHDPAWPLRQARGDRIRRALPRLRRGGFHHGRGTPGRWWLDIW